MMHLYNRIIYSSTKEWRGSFLYTDTWSNSKSILGEKSKMQNVWYASSGIRKERNKNIYFYLFPLKNWKDTQETNKSGYLYWLYWYRNRAKANTFVCLFSNYMNLVYIKKLKCFFVFVFKGGNRPWSQTSSVNSFLCHFVCRWP